MVEWDYPHPDIGKFFLKPAGHWFAAFAPAKLQGVIMQVDTGNAPFSFYGLMARRNPTLEYSVKLKIPPRQSQKVSLQFAMTGKLGGISAKGEQIVVQSIPEFNNGELRFQIKTEPISTVLELAENPRAHVELWRLQNGKQTKFAEYGDTALGPVPAGVGALAAGATETLRIPEGAYLAKVNIMIGSRNAVSFTQPLAIGTASLAAELEKLSPTPKIEPLQVDDADRARGYGVFHGGIAVPALKCDGFDLALGRDESESVELCILPTKNTGRFECRVEPAENIQVRLEEYLQPGKQQPVLTDENKFQAAAGDERRFWLTVNASGFSPGTHELKIKLIPEQGVPCELPLRLHVYPVALPPVDAAEMTMWQTFSDVQNGLGESAFADMQRMGLREIKVNFNKRYWKSLASVTRNADGTASIDLDPVLKRLETARKYGLNQLSIMYCMVNPGWYRKDFGKLNEKEQRNLELQIIGQMVKKFQAAGFENITYFWTDEPPTTIGNAEARRLLELRAAVPSLKIGMTVNHMREAMIRGLQPAVDVWYMSRSTADPMLKNYASPEDDVRIYYAYAKIYEKPYDDLRGNGFYSAFLNLRCYGVYNYYKASQRPDQIVFLKDGKLLHTPARLAVEDGFDDFRYLRKLELLESRLNSDKSPEAGALRARVRKFRQEAWSKDGIGIKDSFRYGNRFRSMSPTDRQTYYHLRLKLMPLLNDLQNHPGSNAG